MSAKNAISVFVLLLAIVYLIGYETYSEPQSTNVIENRASVDYNDKCQSKLNVVIDSNSMLTLEKQIIKGSVTFDNKKSEDSYGLGGQKKAMSSLI